MLNTSSSSHDKNSRITNHLANRTSLTHTYYALRHGQSLANVAHIISSDPQISIDNHGLSEVGKLQAQAAGDAFVRDYLSNNIRNTPPSTTTSTTTTKYQGVAIFSSDFKRARETSTIFVTSLRKANIPIFLGSVIHDSRLRERYFGTLNNGPDNRYQQVWDGDSTNPNHTTFHNESANDVLERTTKFICELDDNILSSSSSLSSVATAATTTINDGTTTAATATTTKNEEGGRWICILVAHGDVLQITQTGFLRHIDARGHRSLNHLETATLRELTLAPLFTGN
jgi:broad specificity phosphatase PhoE